MIPVFVTDAQKLGLEKFLANNEDQSFVQDFMGSFDSAFERCLGDQECEFAVFASEHMVLPRNFQRYLSEAIESLDYRRHSWGAIGNFGITPFAFGMSHSNVVKYRNDVGSLVSVGAEALPSTSLFTDLVLINFDALRLAGVTTLVPHSKKEIEAAFAITMAEARLGMIVSPKLATFSLSAREFPSSRTFKLSRKLEQRLSEQSRYKTVSTVLGKHEITFSAKKSILERNLDFNQISLKENGPHPRKTISIVIRTQFRDKFLINRTIMSARSYAAQVPVGEIEIVVVSDRNPPWDIDLSEVTYIQMAEPEDRDTRFLLVELAGRKLTSDYLWFVDDDDWMFPNAASLLANTMTNLSKETLVLIGSRHFHERNLVVGQDRDPNTYQVSPGHYFSTRNFRLGLTGLNQIPFCSVLWPVNLIRAVSREAVDSVTYAEDFFLLLHGLSLAQQVAFVDRMFVGISIRENGNTVNETNRSKWHQSSAEISYFLSNTPSYGKLLSTYTREQIVNTGSTRPGLVRRLVALLRDPNAWRSARDLRLFSRVLSGELSPIELFRKILLILR